MLREAIVQDAAIPRIYPVDWSTSNEADDIAWGAPGVVRPGSDFLMRERLEEVRAGLNVEQPAP